MIDHYEKLYTSSNSDTQVETQAHVPQAVTDDMNAKLMGEFMEWELSAALKQIASLKVIDLDGKPPLFFQHFW